MKRLGWLLIFCSLLSVAAIKGNGTSGAMIFGDGSSACIHCMLPATSYSEVYWVHVTGSSSQLYVSLITCEVSVCADVQSIRDTSQHYICRNVLGAPDVVDLGALATGSWHHVACTWDGSNLRGYLDGVLKGTTASTAKSTGNAGLLSLFTYVATPAAFGNDALAEVAYFNNMVLNLNEIKGMASGVTPTTIHRPTVYSPLWGTGLTPNSEADLSGCLQAAACGGQNTGAEAFGVYQVCTSGCNPGTTGVSIANHAPVRPYSTEEEAQGGQ